MDSEDAQRDDRFARYVLTGLIVTVCTWALTLMGVADSVIPYVLPPAILILCGRYILVGSISDVEPQAHALACVVGGIALGVGGCQRQRLLLHSGTCRRGKGRLDVCYRVRRLGALPNAHQV